MNFNSFSNILKNIDMIDIGVAFVRLNKTMNLIEKIVIPRCGQQKFDFYGVHEVSDISPEDSQSIQEMMINVTYIHPILHKEVIKPYKAYYNSLKNAIFILFPFYVIIEYL